MNKDRDIEGLPVYNITFDPDTFESGIDLIALTQNPAIETTALRFTKDEKLSEPFLMFTDEEKKIVAGPAIIPDKPIYRRVNDKEFYVVFSKETIEKMVEKFNSENRDYKFNIEHDSERLVAGFIKGSWIIEDTDKDKSSFYGFTDLPVGTWFIEAKVQDNKIWDDVIKTMDKVGFSIEGLMGAIGLELSSNKVQNKENKENKEIFMEKINVKTSILVNTFNEDIKKFESVTTDKDLVLEVSALEEGGTVQVEVEGEMVPAEDGNYVSEDGIKFTVKEGVIVSIEEKEVEEVKEVKEEKETELEEVKEDETKETEEVEEVEEDDPKEDELVEELVAKIADLETRIEALEASNKETEEDKEVFERTPLTVAERIQAFKTMNK